MKDKHPAKKIERPVCVVIAALGGQGGGVLTDWLVQAARAKGFPAQATSIPGVAQRTGATTYYFEVYPQANLKRRPVFSIYPAPGAVDLQLSFEPTEAARALSAGLIGPETTVVTAKERIFSTAEKMLPGAGTQPVTPVLTALKECAGKLCVVDMARAAQKAKCHPSAVMYGAMAESGVLPFSLEDCRRVIEVSGFAVEKNLAGFDAGASLGEVTIAETLPPAAKFDAEPVGFSESVRDLPASVRQMAGHGCARLVDYQGEKYARQYLEQLKSFAALDSEANSHRLIKKVARRLAAWMAFEDVIRVAQLKTRPGRMDRIRGELGVGPRVPLNVFDYLKPGREEIVGLLPKGWADMETGRKTVYGKGPALRLKTSGPFGWMMMSGLAKLRGWRPRTVRYAHEQEMIERWLTAIKGVAQSDYDLACKIADMAVWARGYGETRAKGFDQLNSVFNMIAMGDEIEKAVDISLAAAYSASD